MTDPVDSNIINHTEPKVQAVAAVSSFVDVRPMTEPENTATTVRPLSDMGNKAIALAEQGFHVFPAFGVKDDHTCRCNKASCEPRSRSYA